MSSDCPQAIGADTSIRAAAVESMDVLDIVGPPRDVLTRQDRRMYGKSREDPAASFSDSAK
jgi:hypothetical protein